MWPMGNKHAMTDLQLSTQGVTMEINLNKLRSIISLPYFGNKSNETRGNQDCIHMYIKQVKNLFCHEVLMRLRREIFLRGGILKDNVYVN
jgi:hypothetical protein